MRSCFAVLGFTLLVASAPARAEVEYFAVIVGNNRGDRDKADLRFAEADAAKLHELLLDLGGFEPQNTILLQGRDASTVSRVLIDINDRIRNRRHQGQSKAVLLVYYSGHADALALHLGSTPLAIEEVKQLVSGSAAQFRLLILDSCRSGALTQPKGLRSKAEPFLLEVDEQLAAEGVVFLTASASDEDAQESDELRGSFFTHFLVSGLSGSADEDGDGRVVLDEAYRYAFDNTLRASSRTLAGLQHPSFHYSLSGQGQVVLSYLSRQATTRAAVVLPPGRQYLLLKQNRDGPVVVEVGAHDRRRRVLVRPGIYHVVGRGQEYLLEGELSLSPGKELVVEEGQLDRFEYARMVRKGARERSLSHGPQLGYQMKGALSNGERLCHGVVVDYSIDFEHFSIASRFGFCTGAFENRSLSARVTQLELDLRLSMAWDLPWLSLQPGISIGPAIHRQEFDTTGRASPRTSAGGHAGLFLGVLLDLPGGFLLGLEGAAQIHVFKLRSADPLADDDGELNPSVCGVFSVLLGKRF